MIRSERRNRVAANEPVSAPSAGGPDDQATKDATASPPLAPRPQAAPGPLRPPWLTRNSRKATIALVLSVLAASPFVYRYLERNFGPDPLAGIKVDAVKFDPASGIFEVVKPAEVKPVEGKPAGAKPATAKPIAVAKPADLAREPVPPLSSASPAAQFKIAAADERGTYFAIGNDLARFVAPGADIDLEVMPTDGSAANIKLLRYESGVKFAIVQADVYQAFVDRSAAANAEAARIIRPLRVILPLYNTEIHYIVRADSELNYLHDLRNAKINGGLVASGAAFITHTLYRMMFKEPIPEANASFLPDDEALVKLITEKSIDVVVVAAGQPAPLIANMKPEAQKFIKILKFDPGHASSRQPLTVYAPATVRAASYPNLLKEDFTTISVGAFLVTYDYNLQSTVESMARFGRSLCQNFATLQEKGHPKWREVQLSLPALNPGWSYYLPATREIRGCVAGRKPPPPAPPAATRKQACAPGERILGYCN